MSIKFKNILSLGLLLSLLLSQRLVYAQDPQVIRLGQAMTTAGDMIINNTRAQAARLPIGTLGQVLTVNSSGIPEWSGSPILLNPTISGNLTFTSATAKIIPGATSLNFRDTADSADNLKISDNGVFLIRNDIGFNDSSFYVYATSIDGADGSTMYLTSGGTNNKSRGGYISLSGNEAAGTGAVFIAGGNTTGGHIISEIGNSSALFYWRNASSNIMWSLNNSGQLIQDATSGGDIVGGLSAFVIRQSTADGADNRIVQISSGNTAPIDGTRGAEITLRGNEAGGAGDLFLFSGNASTSDLTLRATASDGNIFVDTASTRALTIESDQDALFTQRVTSSRATDIGWSVVNAVNQACNTTCTSACVVGIDTLGTGGFLGCAVATADSCVCAGAS